MKYYISILVLMIFATSISAQEGGKDEKSKMEKQASKIAAKKVGYFTEELDLSAEEAQAFWPIYNDFQEKIRSLKIQSKKNRHENIEFSEEEGEVYLNNVFDNEQKILDLKRSSYKELERALPKAKIAKLYIIERKFREKIYSSLKRKMKGRGVE